MSKKQKNKAMKHKLKVLSSHLSDSTLLAALALLQGRDVQIDVATSVLGITLDDTVFGTATGRYSNNNKYFQWSLSFSLSLSHTHTECWRTEKRKTSYWNDVTEALSHSLM